MKQNFLISAIPKAVFKSYFQASDSELDRLNAQWLIADTSPGYPCRVSLIDAQVGERVLACHFEHLRVSTVYRASGPVFVREKAVTAVLKVNQIPSILYHRQLSLRAYNMSDMMIDASLVMGTDVHTVIQTQLNNSAVEYIHIHNAAPGCFSCSVCRV